MQIQHQPFGPIKFNSEILNRRMLNSLNLMTLKRDFREFQFEIDTSCKKSILTLIKKSFLAGLISVNESDKTVESFISKKAKELTESLDGVFGCCRGVAGVSVVNDTLSVGFGMDRGNWAIDQISIWENPQRLSPVFLRWVTLFNSICNSSSLFGGYIEVDYDECDYELVSLLELDEISEDDFCNRFSLNYFASAFDLDIDFDLGIDELKSTFIELGKKVNEYKRLEFEFFKSADWILVEFNLLKAKSLKGLSKSEKVLVKALKEFIQFLVANKIDESFYSTTGCNETFDIYNQILSSGYVILSENHANLIKLDYIEYSERGDIEGFTVDIDEDFKEKTLLLGHFDDLLLSVVNAFADYN